MRTSASSASNGSGAPRELNVKFKVLKFLGKGSYGSVFQVQRLSDGQQYALKEMDVKAMSQAEREDSANEIRLLASIQHPNVISYHEAFLDGNRLCIIMEYAADGDLARLIKKCQTTKTLMPEDTIWRYLIQIARGVQALHAMKILHRDIKPGNIMISGDVVKIGDLGISKLIKHTMAKTQIGTPHYMPPEIWKNQPYAFSSDTWALGCLVYEMATLNVPFEARSMSELRYKVLKGSYPPVSSVYSTDLINFVRNCLDPNPARRPTMDEILSSHAVSMRMSLLRPEIARAPPSTASSVLLNTIKVPRNFALIKNKLPAAQYEADMAREAFDYESSGPPQNVYEVRQDPPASGMNVREHYSAPGPAPAQRPLYRDNARPPYSQGLPPVPPKSSQSDVYPASQAYGQPPYAPQQYRQDAPRLPAIAGTPQYPIKVNVQPQGGRNRPADNGQPSWYNSQAGAAPPVSESHARYGNFYGGQFSPKEHQRQPNQFRELPPQNMYGARGMAPPPPPSSQASHGYGQPQYIVPKPAQYIPGQRGGPPVPMQKLPAIDPMAARPPRSPVPGHVPWNAGKGRQMGLPAIQSAARVNPRVEPQQYRDEQSRYPQQYGRPQWN